MYGGLSTVRFFFLLLLPLFYFYFLLRERGNGKRKGRLKKDLIFFLFASPPSLPQVHPHHVPLYPGQIRTRYQPLRLQRHDLLHPTTRSRDLKIERQRSLCSHGFSRVFDQWGLEGIVGKVGTGCEEWIDYYRI